MADLEKVIKGLECCLVSIDSEGCTKECPYYEACQKSEYYDVFQPVMKDALELLKAQEPKLLTIEEITGDGECWFEGINGAYGYADCYMCTASEEVEVNLISRKPEYVSFNDFMKKWRCWTSRPTDAQREATQWN